MHGFAITYLRIAAFGIPSLLLMLAATGVAARAPGHPDPAVVAVVANLLNIGLNLLFVYGFDWGIAGSAVGHGARPDRRGRAPSSPSSSEAARRYGPPWSRTDRASSRRGVPASR